MHEPKHAINHRLLPFNDVVYHINRNLEFLGKRGFLGLLTYMCSVKSKFSDNVYKPKVNTISV